MVTSPLGLGPERDYTISIYKRQTHPPVREGAPQNQDRNCQRVINIWSMGLDTKTYLLTGRQ
jgi:hypothetical protein